MEKPLQESDEGLVEQAVRRDRAAFTALYERYVDQIYRHIYYRVGNHADAEDITEEVFIRAWKAIDRFKKTGAPFVAWLITIARNLVIDHYKARRNHISLDKVECTAGSDSDPQAAAEASLDRNRVRKAIRKLNGEKQKVILMRFIDGFSYPEIARALNKSEGAIRVIQCRALTELRRILTDWIP